VYWGAGGVERDGVGVREVVWSVRRWLVTFTFPLVVVINDQ